MGMGYDKTYDLIYNRYTPAPKEYGGVIQESVNAKSTENFRVSIDITGSLFDRKLNITAGPFYSRNWAKEGGFKNMSRISFDASADYTIGNCRLKISYQNMGSSYNSNGLEKHWRQNRMDLSLTYGIGDFYLFFKVNDIFHNKSKDRIQFYLPNYSTNYEYLTTGRLFVLDLTYTFGYGKKVDKSIEISGPGATSSSIRTAK